MQYDNYKIRTSANFWTHKRHIWCNFPLHPDVTVMRTSSMISQHHLNTKSTLAHLIITHPFWKSPRHGHRPWTPSRRDDDIPVAPSPDLSRSLGGTWKWSRDHFVNVLSQWETTLHCNVVSHWLGAYTKWSLRCTSDPLWQGSIFPVYLMKVDPRQNQNRLKIQQFSHDIYTLKLYH